MEEGRESVAASGYRGGTGARSGSGGKDDNNSASLSPSPTPSLSASPPPPPPPAAVATSAGNPGGVGMGLFMGPAGVAAPHHPLGLGGLGRVVGMGMVAGSMMAAVGNAGFGEDFSRKKRGRARKYAPEGGGMHGGASLTLSSPASSVVHFSPVSAGEYLSSESSGAKRGRGRPRGSGRRQLLAALGEWFAYSAGGNFTPHIITIAAGEDVATRILSFSHKGPRAICILSANGSVSNVTLRQPGSSGGTLSYEGRFEILSLSGSFTITENDGIRTRTGGISVSLAGPDGRVVGGGVAGLLLAASPIQVVVGSFLPNIMKQHKQRPNLPSPTFSTIPTASGVLTAARPLSQTNPDDECKTPTSTLHGHNNSQGEAQQHQSNSSKVVPNYSASSFRPDGTWHGLQSSTEQKPSPDINVCLIGE